MIISRFTVSQIEENEHYLLTDMNDLTVSQTIGQYMGDLGIFDIEIDTLETYGDTSIENARFQSSVSDENLKTLIENQENVNTKGNTKWGINVFNKWREQRDINIPELYEMDTITMNYWLQRFIVEARRQDGAEYPPRSLYLIAVHKKQWRT